MYVLVITNDGDYEGPDIHGPFEEVVDAQAYAERYRERNGLPGPATSENNDTWTNAGWYFGIVQPHRDLSDVLPGGKFANYEQIHD